MQTTDDEIGSFIEMAESDLGNEDAPTPVAKWTPIRTVDPVRPFRVVCPSEEIADWQAAVMFKSSDLTAFAWKTANGFGQITKDSLNRANVAKYRARWHDEDFDKSARTKTLTKKRIKAGLLGGEELLVRGRWGTTKDPKTGEVVGHYLCPVRFDFDYRARKHSVDDTLAASQWLNEEYGLDLPGCPSSHGYSLYVIFEVPSRDGIPLCKKVEFNRFIQNLNEGLTELLRQAGFQCSAECIGSFQTAVTPTGLYDDDEPDSVVPIGPTVIEKMTTTCKIGALQSIADVDKLATPVRVSPTLGHHGMPANYYRLLQNCIVGGKIAAERRAAEKAAAESQRRLQDKQDRFEFQQEQWDEESVADVVREVTGRDEIDFENESELDACLAKLEPKRSSKAKPLTRIIGESCCKPTNRINCVIRAGQLLDRRTYSQREGSEDEIKDLAKKLYVENGLGDADDDADRQHDFRYAFQSFLRKTNDALAGRGTLLNWFEDEHLKLLDEKFSSVVSKAELKGLSITVRDLSVTAACMAKNVVVPGKCKNGQAGELGAVPHAAVAGMLKDHNLGYGEKRVSLLMNMVLETGAIVCVERDYGPRRCRRYAVSKPEWFPFIEPAALTAAHLELKPLIDRASLPARLVAMESAVVNGLLVAALAAGLENYSSPSQYGSSDDVRLSKLPFGIGPVPTTNDPNTTFSAENWPKSGF